MCYYFRMPVKKGQKLKAVRRDTTLPAVRVTAQEYNDIKRAAGSRKLSQYIREILFPPAGGRVNEQNVDQNQTPIRDKS